MKKYPRRVTALVLGLVIACSAVGQSAIPEAAAQERLRIEVERKQVDADFEIQQRECQTKFAATPCAHDAQMRRIEAMAGLKRRELSLNNAARAEESAAKQRSIDEKQAQREASTTAARAAAQQTHGARQQAQQDKLQQHISGSNTLEDRATVQKEVTPVQAGRLEKNRAQHASKLQAAEKRKLQRDQRLAETKRLPTSFLPVPP
jgi:hypothetical protein